MAQQQGRRKESKRVQSKPISKKRKFIKDGVFYAELNDFLAKELAEDGYAGCEVRVTPTRTEVIIRATKPRDVVGEEGRRIREITALIQKRFKYKQGRILLFAEKIRNKGLSALAQAQAVKFRLLQGLSVRRAAYSVVKFIMDKGAKGCEVVVSGKLRGQRAKAMKFRDGYMIHAGDATNYYVEKAVKHVHLRQGVIGIKVKIMLPYDDNGEGGVDRDLPDAIKVHDPDKDEVFGFDAQQAQISQNQASYQPDTQPPDMGDMGDMGGMGPDDFAPDTQPPPDMGDMGQGMGQMDVPQDQQMGGPPPDAMDMGGMPPQQMDMNQGQAPPGPQYGGGGFQQQY